MFGPTSGTSQTAAETERDGGAKSGEAGKEDDRHASTFVVSMLTSQGTNSSTDFPEAGEEPIAYTL